MMSRLLAALAVVLMAFPTASRAAAGTVNVLYAGSLVNLMERDVGPAFQKQTGLRFQGYGAGSKQIANELKSGLRRGDVFISASPKVDDGLMGQANGGRVAWYAAFAASPLMIGYSPQSRFAADFRAKPWIAVLQSPGIRIGRTDSKLDPKGALTWDMMTKAEALYHQPGLVQRTLGAQDNPDQVFPEEALVGRLQSGQLDAGFFYSTEITDLKIPAIGLPPALQARAVYTITVLPDAANAAGAQAFVRFLLGPKGRALLEAHGVALVAPSLSGDAAAVPASLKPVLRVSG